MSEPEEPDDDPGPLDGKIQYPPPRTNGRAARKASPRGRLAAFEGDAKTAIEGLGPPPKEPAKLALWFQRVAGTLAWVGMTTEIGPGQQARIKIALEAAREAGRNAVKALDKERQLTVSRRLGLVEKDADGLDDYPGSPSELGRTRPPDGG